MKLNALLTKRLTRNAAVLAFVAGAAVSLFSPLVQTAIAAPQGANVVAGQVGITRRGDVTRIRASDGAIINFKSFNIAPNETVRFLQPNAHARVLNRINGAAPSVIEGRLLANGQVFLINRAGVTFSKDAVVNVGGIIAAAGNMSDADFKSGLLRFTDSAGNVVNAGTIQANNIALIGRKVANSGIIASDGGTVVFASGEDVFVGQRNGRVFVKVDNPSAVNGAQPGVGVEQSGTVDAGPGAVAMEAGDLYSLAIRHSGRTVARDVQMKASQKSTVQVAGEVSSRNLGAGSTGGRIDITAGNVDIAGATIDASGNDGGGNVNIGGELKGSGELPHALRVTLGADSSIEADAIRKGDGGTVVLWSTADTTIHGNVSANGAASGGDGGLIETSSKGVVHFAPTLSLSAKSGIGGKAGTWLLDPTDVTIAAVDPMDGTTFTDVATIQTMLDAGTNVLVEADHDIVSDVAITTSTATPVTLAFRAGNSIFIRGDIGTTGAALNLELAADTFPVTLATDGIGNVQISGGPEPVFTLAGGTFRSIGADFSIQTFANIHGASSIQLEHSGAISGFVGPINTGGASVSVLTRSGFLAPTLTLGNILNLTTGGGDARIDGTIVGGLNSVVINAGSGRVLLGTIASAGSVQLTSSNAGADAISVGSVASTGLQLYTGKTTLSGTYITSGNSFTVTGDAVLAGDTGVATGGSLIWFQGAVKSDGTPRSLTLNADADRVVIAGAVGSTTLGERISTFQAVSSNAATDAISVHDVYSTAGQTYTGNATLNGTYSSLAGAFSAVNSVVLAGDTTVTTATGLLTFQSTIKSDGTPRALTLNAGTNKVRLLGAVGSAVGGEKLSTFSATSTNVSIDAISAVGVSTTGDQTYTGRTQLVGDYSANNFLITGPGIIGGNVTALGTFEITGSANLDGVFASGGSFTLGNDGQVTGSITTTNSNFSIAAGLTLSDDLTISTGSGNISLNGFLNGGGFDATFNSTGATLVVGAITNVDALSTDLGGTSEFRSTVAATTSLNIADDLTVRGATYTTTGSQSFKTITLDALAPATVSFSGVGITSGAINAAGKNLTLDAGAGKLLITGNVSSVGTFSASSTNAGADAISVRDVASTANQLYIGRTTFNGTYNTNGGNFTQTGAATLGGATAVVSTGGDISFTSTIAGGGFTLLLPANGGKISVAGDISNVNGALFNSTNVAADAISVANVTSDGQITFAGKTQLNGTSYTTTNDQIVFADTLRLNASPTLSTGSGNVLFSGIITKTGSTDGDLSVTSSGSTTFQTNLTLGDLLVNGGGTTFFGTTAGVTNLTLTATSVQIDDAVVLRSMTGGTFTVTTAAASTGDKSIRFGSTVQSSSPGVSGLTLNAGGSTGGNITVTGIIGGSGNTLSTLSTSGNVVQLSGAITSVGGQNVGGSSVQLMGSYLTGGADFIVSGPQIILNGGPVLIDAGGALITLTGVINGQSNDFTLQNFSTLTFNGAASQMRDITVSAPGGQVIFNGALTGNMAGDLSITGVGPTTFNGDVTQFQTINVSGSTVLGGDLSASGSITLDSVALGGASRSLTGVDITLGAVTGNNANFTINDSGTTHLTGDITGFNQFFTSAAGTTQLNSGVDLSGVRIVIRDDLVFAGGASIFTTSGSAGISLEKTVNGPVALTLTAGTSAISIGGEVGGATALTSLSATGTAIGVGSVRTTGTQTYAGPTAFNGTLYRTTNAALTVTGITTMPGNADRTLNLGTGGLTFGANASSGNGASVSINAGSATFAGTMSSGENLFIDSPGLTWFQRSVNANGTLRTDAPGTSRFDANGGALLIDIRDPATLGGSAYAGTNGTSFADITLTHDVEVSYISPATTTLGAIAGGGHDLKIISSGTTNLTGDITDLGGLFTAGIASFGFQGTVRIATGRSITAESIRFFNSVLLLGGTTTITTLGPASSSFLFGQGLNGPGALVLNANGGAKILAFGAGSGMWGKDTPLASLTINGDSQIGGVRTIGPQTYNGNALFERTLESSNADIIINGNSFFGGFNVGVNTQGGDFKVTGTTTVNGDTFSADTAGGHVELGSTTMIVAPTADITSGGGNIKILGPLTVTGSMFTLNTGGGNAQLDSTTSLGSTSTAVTTAGGDLSIASAFDFTGNIFTLHAGGGAVSFGSTATFGGATTDVQTAGGAFSIAGISSFNSVSTSLSTGGAPMQFGDLATFSGPTVTLATFGSTGGDIDFTSASFGTNSGTTSITTGGGALTSSGALTFLSPLTTINSAGGNISVGGSLTTQSTATNITTGGGAFSALGATTLPVSTTSLFSLTTGGGNVLFSQAVTGKAAMTINAGSGTLSLFNIGSSIDPLARVSLAGSTISVGNVLTTGDQVYDGNLVLSGSLYRILQAGNFRALGNLTLSSDAFIRTNSGFQLFQGNISGAGRELTLRSNADSTLTGAAYRFGSNTITVGKLTFNNTGNSTFTFTVGQRATMLDVATIVFSDRFNNNGTLQTLNAGDSFSSTNFNITAPGGFIMSDVDRLVAFGNLNVNATGGRADLSWMAALGTLSVSAANFNTYRGAQFLGGDGLTFTGGAFGELASSSNPASQTTFFSVNDPSTASVNNIEFRNRQTTREEPFGVSRFIAGTSTIIPLPTGVSTTATVTPAILANGKLPGSVAGDVASITAAITDQEASRISTPGVVGDIADDLLKSLQLVSRNLEATDLIQFFVGRSLYVDMPRNYPASSANNDYAVTRNRLQPLSLAETVRVFDAFLGTERPQQGEKQDQAKYETRIIAHQKALDDSWAAFRAQEPEGGLKEYQQFVETNPEAAPAKATLAELKGVMEKVNELGLSPLETNIIKRAIVDKVVTDPELASELYVMFGAAEAVSTIGAK
jgi:filamentous hemagglutinin family protein